MIRRVVLVQYRDRLKGMQILLSRTQAEQVSKSRNKLLATTYKPFSRSLYFDGEATKRFRLIVYLPFRPRCVIFIEYCVVIIRVFACKCDYDKA